MRKKLSIIIGIAVVVLAAIALDQYVGYRQNRYLSEKAALKKKLERLAWYSLRGEVKQVAYAGSDYRVSIQFENAFPEEEMHIMVPQMRCFVQVGTLWKEVPINDDGSQPAQEGVIHLTGIKTIEKLITVPFKNFEEVLPGYMHVRINTMSFIASDAVSKDDIVEKNEDFYIYLKPSYANNRQMSRKYSFTNDEIPIFIPMPPH